MSLYKRAFARGMNDRLMSLGYVRYPSKTAADEIADVVGDEMPVEPAVEAVPPEVAADVATQLVDAANQLVEATGGVEAPAMAEAEEVAKQAAAMDIGTIAAQQAGAVMHKLAMEKEAKGSTIEGGDKGNTMGQAVQAETEMENKNRPQGVHILGVGNTNHPVGQGNVGTEQVPAPKAPGESPSGSNSVIQQSKMGSTLQQIIQKVAMGSTIAGGDKGNTLPQAAGVTGEAKLEGDRRPMGYAQAGVGNTQFPIGSGVVGSEQAHPDQPGETPGGTPGAGNSVTQWSGTAPAKQASEDAFVTLFKQTAEKVASALPATLNEDTKIAHVRQMMGMTADEQGQYLNLLQKEAGEMPEALKEKLKEKAEELEESPESKSDKKKEEKEEAKEEKEAAAAPNLLSRIRRVAQQTLATA